MASNSISGHQGSTERPVLEAHVDPSALKDRRRLTDGFTPSVPKTSAAIPFIASSSHDDASVVSLASAATLKTGRKSSALLQPRISATLPMSVDYPQAPTKRAAVSPRDKDTHEIVHAPSQQAHIADKRVLGRKRTRLKPQHGTACASADMEDNKIITGPHENEREESVGMLSDVDESGSDSTDSRGATCISDDEEIEWKRKARLFALQKKDLAKQLSQQAALTVQVGLKYQETVTALEQKTQLLNEQANATQSLQETHRQQSERLTTELHDKSEALQSQESQVQTLKNQILMLEGEADTLMKENSRLLQVLESARAETSNVRYELKTQIRTMGGQLQKGKETIYKKDSLLEKLQGQTQELERIKLGLSIQVQRLESNKSTPTNSSSAIIKTSGASEDRVKASTSNQLDPRGIFRETDKERRRLDESVREQARQIQELSYRLTVVQAEKVSAEEKLRSLKGKFVDNESMFQKTRKELQEVKDVSQSRILKLQDSLKSRTKETETLIHERDRLQEQLETLKIEKNAYLEDMRVIHETKIDALSAQYEAKEKTMIHDLDEAVASIDNKQQDIETLKKDLHEANVCIGALKMSSYEDKANLVLLNKEVSALKQDLESNEGEVATSQDEKTKLQQLLSTSTKGSEQQSQEFKLRLKSLEDENLLKTREISSITEQLSVSTAKLKEVEDEYTRSAQEVDGLISERELLIEKTRNIEQSLRNEIGDLKGIHGQVDFPNEEVNTLKNTLLEKSIEIQALANDRNILRGEIDAIKTSYIAQLQETDDNAQRAKEMLEGKFAQDEKSLLAEIESISLQLEGSRMENSRLRDECEQISSTYQKKLKQIEDRLTKTMGERDESERNNTRLTSQLSEANAKGDMLQHDIEKLRLDFDQATEKHNVDLNRLQLQIKEKIDIILSEKACSSELKSQMKHENENTEKIREMLRASEKRIIDLETLLKDDEERSNTEMTTLETANNTLKEENRTLRNQITSLVESSRSFSKEVSVERGKLERKLRAQSESLYDRNVDVKRLEASREQLLERVSELEECQQDRSTVFIANSEESEKVAELRRELADSKMRLQSSNQSRQIPQRTAPTNSFRRLPSYFLLGLIVCAFYFVRKDDGLSGDVESSICKVDVASALVEAPMLVSHDAPEEQDTPFVPKKRREVSRAVLPPNSFASRKYIQRKASSLPSETELPLKILPGDLGNNEDTAPTPSKKTAVDSLTLTTLKYISTFVIKEEEHVEEEEEEEVPEMHKTPVLEPSLKCTLHEMEDYWCYPMLTLS